MGINGPEILIRFFKPAKTAYKKLNTIKLKQI